MPQPPKKRLTHPPTVESVEEVELALEELAWCEAASKTEDAKLDSEIQAARARSSEARVIRIARQQTTLSERGKLLKTAIEQFATDHPDDVQASGKRSRKFTHGTVGFRQIAGGITTADGETTGSVVKRLDGLSKLLEKIADFLSVLALRIRGRRKVSAVVLGLELKPSLKLSRIAASLQEGTLTKDDLTALGLVQRAPRNEVFVTPAEYRPDLPDAAAE